MITATEQLRLYRTRHVIKPTGSEDPGMCAVDHVGILQRRSGRREIDRWRHDPDDIKLLIQQAQEESIRTIEGQIMARQPWQAELLRIAEREHWGFALHTEVSDVIRRAIFASHHQGA